ncbi:hypothetical protein DVA67_014745 [Solirubrobacter sp. CPCC 204708]|uniref:Uncharacterized protein n=1 Tax=Solirubrobacter deserti TaxID=2282478 RepID=A0ABT4RBI1_9ACTN|nr:hypothetical protein [Solirubrobacter deserti]MBE2317237.1 hypothetical protein [Solirubrobacter deserti]MDA0135871.1 hypothetical protein [Solirubrobacter deserti]
MLRVVVVALAVLVLLPAAAIAREPAELWATVNVCDTAKQPDAIGIRASMPGTPKGARLSMRFRVQYRLADGTWEDVEDADSGWRNVGIAKGVPLEYGWSFTFAKRTTPVTLRGVVKFRTRRGNTLPREQEAATEAGHPTKAGSDPVGYSAATCLL